MVRQRWLEHPTDGLWWRRQDSNLHSRFLPIELLPQRPLLYQLSYWRIWRPIPDLNWCPLAWQASVILFFTNGPYNPAITARPMVDTLEFHNCLAFQVLFRSLNVIPYPFTHSPLVPWAIGLTSSGRIQLPCKLRSSYPLPLKDVYRTFIPLAHIRRLW